MPVNPTYPQYVTVSQIVGSAKPEGLWKPIIPIGRSTWWKAVKDGRAPKPIKLGSRTTVWRLSDVIDFVESQSNIEQE